MLEHQAEIEAFIMSSLGDYANTQDVLQRTNMVLWKKAAQFRDGARFIPWAIGIAKYEVLAFMRTRKRDRHVFRSDLVELMADVAYERSGGIAGRLDALRECIKKLPEPSRELLAIRYSHDHSIDQVAEKTGRTPGAVRMLFCRIRRRLNECITRRLAAQTG